MVFRLHRMNAMQTVGLLTNVRGVSLYVCHECTEWPRLGFTVGGGACSVRRVTCARGHLVQPSPNAFGLLFLFWSIMADVFVNTLFSTDFSGPACLYLHLNTSALCCVRLRILSGYFATNTTRPHGMHNAHHVALCDRWSRSTECLPVCLVCLLCGCAVQKWLKGSSSVLGGPKVHSVYIRWVPILLRQWPWGGVDGDFANLLYVCRYWTILVWNYSRIDIITLVYALLIWH